MKRSYPVYTLFIDVPSEMVDVNVHPNKSDVRFVDNQLIFGTVYKVISSVLDGSAKAADFVVDSKVVPEIASTFAEKKSKNAVYAGDYTQPGKVYDKNFEGIDIPKFTPEGKICKTEPRPAPAEPKKDYSVFERMEREPVEPKSIESLPDDCLRRYEAARYKGEGKGARKSRTAAHYL